MAARALASLALARQYAPDRTLRAEISLAYALGYVEHAVALAERLPRDEPLAAYVRRDFGALERVAEWSKSGDVHFYYAARLVRARSAEEWIAWYRKLSARARAADAAVVRTALEEPDPALGELRPGALRHDASSTRFGVPAPRSDRPEWALGQCDALRPRGREERRAARAAPSPTGALHRLVSRRVSLGAVPEARVHWLEAKKSPDAALALARGLPQSRARLAALRDWTELVAATRGERAGSAPRLAKAVATPSGLGVEPRLRLARRAARRAGRGRPAAHRRRRRAGARARLAPRRARRRGRPRARGVPGPGPRGEALRGGARRRPARAPAARRPARRVPAATGSRCGRWPSRTSFRLDARMAALEGLERQKPLESMRLAPRLRAPADRVHRLAAAAPPVRALPREDAPQPQGRARMVLIPILAEYEEHDPASDSVAGIIARLYREEGDPRSAWELLEPRRRGDGRPVRGRARAGRAGQSGARGGDRARGVRALQALARAGRRARRRAVGSGAQRRGGRR